MSRFDHIFNRLNLEEKARIFDHAKGRGYIVTTIADEAAFAPVVPIAVIPSAEIPRSDFAHLDEVTFEALRNYYATAEDKDSRIYPPLGYTPSVRQEEKDAAAFLSYMLLVADKDGIEAAIKEGYPLTAAELPSKTLKSFGRKANSPKEESAQSRKRKGLKSRLTSLFA